MNKKWSGIKVWLVASLLSLVTLSQTMTVEATGMATQNLPNTGEEIAKTAIIGGIIIIAVVIIIVLLRRKKDNNE